MNVHQVKEPAAYVRYLQENPHEIDMLFSELLISVTNFFRDPQAFEVLAAKALPAMLESRTDSSSLRVWVPGCATGEEAYSLAIMLREVPGSDRPQYLPCRSSGRIWTPAPSNGRGPAAMAASIAPDVARSGWSSFSTARTAPIASARKSASR